MDDKSSPEFLALARENWERARGDPCPSCGQETLRFLDGLCLSCRRGKDLKDVRAIEHISMALTYRVLPRKPRKPIHFS